MKGSVEDCYGRGDGRVRRGAPLSLPSMYPGLSEKCPRFFSGSFFVRGAGTLRSGRDPTLFFSSVRRSWAKRGSKGEL